MKRLKDYSSISWLKWCHWNCNGISSFVSVADAALLWCVAKHFKLVVSYMWLGITKLCIFSLYCILEPHLSGISRKYTLPSSFLLIKMFMLVQKPQNQFDLEIKLIWSLLTWIYSRLSRIVYLWLSNSFFFSLIFIFLGSCLSRILSLCVLCYYFFCVFLLKMRPRFLLLLIHVFLYPFFFKIAACGPWLY